MDAEVTHEERGAEAAADRRSRVSVGEGDTRAMSRGRTNWGWRRIDAPHAPESAYQRCPSRLLLARQSHPADHEGLKLAPNARTCNCSWPKAGKAEARRCLKIKRRRLTSSPSSGLRSFHVRTWKLASFNRYTR